MKFEVLVGTITMTGTVSGKRNQWAIVVSGPDGIKRSDETVEKDWAPLLNEMLASVHEHAVRKRGQPARPGAVLP